MLRELPLHSFTARTIAARLKMNSPDFPHVRKVYAKTAKSPAPSKLPPQVTQPWSANPGSAKRMQIPSGQKALYYAGMALIGIGFLVFLSLFFRNHTPVSPEDWASPTFSRGRAHEAFERKSNSTRNTAFTGMGLIVLGSVFLSIGARGLAGSGIVLDPEQARRDLEPWSRMKGGMVDDALSEVAVVKAVTKRFGETKTEIKVRCPQCRELNGETAKFCSQCGTPV